MLTTIQAIPYLRERIYGILGRNIDNSLRLDERLDKSRLSREWITGPNRKILETISELMK